MNCKQVSWFGYALVAALPLTLTGCPTPPPFTGGDEGPTDGNTTGPVVTGDGGGVGLTCEVTCPENNDACWTKCEEPGTDVPPPVGKCDQIFQQCLASCQVASEGCPNGAKDCTAADGTVSWDMQCQLMCEEDYKRCLGVAPLPVTCEEQQGACYDSCAQVVPDCKDGETCTAPDTGWCYQQCDLEYKQCVVAPPATCEGALNSCLGACYQTMPCDCGADGRDCACAAPYNPDCDRKCYAVYDNCVGTVVGCTADADCGPAAICVFDGGAAGGSSGGVACPDGVACDSAEQPKMPAMLGHCVPNVTSTCDMELKGCLDYCYSINAGGGVADPAPGFVAPECETGCYEAYDVCNGTVTTPCDDELSTCLVGCYPDYPCNCLPDDPACGCAGLPFDPACEQKCYDIYDSCTGTAATCYSDMECPAGETCVFGYPMECPAGADCAPFDAMPALGRCEVTTVPTCETDLDGCLGGCNVPMPCDCDPTMDACACPVYAGGGEASGDVAPGMPMPIDTCYEDCKLAFDRCLAPTPVL